MVRSPVDASLETLLSRLGIAVASILERTFDEILLERMDHTASDHRCPSEIDNAARRR